MIKNIKVSLADLLGESYCNTICDTANVLLDMDKETAKNLVNKKIEFFPEKFINKQKYLADNLGKDLFESFENDNNGAPTDSFRHATKKHMAPIGGLGVFRIGENGKVYLSGKSEHYHTSLGHNFPGYKLINIARELGIMNSIHNNTRGYVTRLLERELIRAANGIAQDDDKALTEVLDSKDAKVINRVINLQTGSLSVEAGVKMMLARFYQLDKSYDKPVYNGKIPVFLVMADNDGGFEANYHGTTIMTQTMRGMWPEFYKKAEQSDLYKVVSVSLNDIDDFEAKIKKYNSGKYKTAGFLHEIIMMNYGAIKLKEEYLQRAYELCEEYSTLTLVDEIQSCMWYKGMFLHKLYNLKPDFIVIGKGFPGGEYPASKILTTAQTDNLNQFGALVTNGQEELASLAYLITMKFAKENAEQIQYVGDYLENRLGELDEKNDKIVKVEGKGHLTAIHFKTVEGADRFAKTLNNMCIDISAQTYKANCPPAALIKPPLITDESIVDIIIGRMNSALTSMED